MVYNDSCYQIQTTYNYKEIIQPSIVDYREKRQQYNFYCIVLFNIIFIFCVVIQKINLIKKLQIKIDVLSEKVHLLQQKQSEQTKQTEQTEKNSIDGEIEKNISTINEKQKKIDVLSERVHLLQQKQTEQTEQTEKISIDGEIEKNISTINKKEKPKKKKKEYLIVYVVENGNCYHRNIDCPRLKRTKIKISIQVDKNDLKQPFCKMC
jgi:septal ring factor EnvC (AmiA/AmiB activator)